MLNKRAFSFRFMHDYRRQSGFVLLSVMLTAIIIGIIALYEARITQQEVEAQQIQRTTQRMQQWLLAALAYRYKYSSWPVTLDYAHNSQDTPSLNQALGYDLVGRYFMPSAIESYGGTSTFAVAQSPSDTSWALKDTLPSENYLIKRDDINDECYTKKYSSTSSYYTACKLSSDDEFKIVAQVPTKQIATQVAAKLPAAHITQYPDNGQAKWWEVHAYVTQSNTQSQSDIPGKLSFASGFLPLPQPSNTQISILNAHSWHTDIKLGLPIKINGHNYVGSQDKNVDPGNYMYNSGSKSGNKYAHVAYVEFNSKNLAYSFNQSTNTFTYFGDSCNYHKKSHPPPNLVVSTPGFHTPIVSKYSVMTDYIPSAQSKLKISESNINSGASIGYPCHSITPGYPCPNAYSYTSLYGLVLMSFEQKHQDNSNNEYKYFLIEALGMSNQARGAYTWGSETFANYEDYQAWHEFSANDLYSGVFDFNDQDKSPTSGDFPDEYGFWELYIAKEHDNRDHFWATPADVDGNVNNSGYFSSSIDQPYQSGIDGVNFFFICGDY